MADRTRAAATSGFCARIIGLYRTGCFRGVQGQVKALRYIFHVVMDAFYTFLADDGWAIASHIALSTLMALFPFLIVLTSLAGFLGSK